MSLVQVLVALGMGSVLIAGSTALFSAQQKNMTGVNLRFNVAAIRQGIQSAVSSDLAWQKTKDDNTLMKCTSNTQQYCRPGETARTPIVLKDSLGNTIIDSRNPRAGFRLNGTPCDTYGVAGDIGCPLRVELTWRASCNTMTCTSLTDYIAVEFKYAAKDKSLDVPFNAVNYNISERPRLALNESFSPLVHCANQNKVYIGPGNTLNGGTADADGCIPYAFLVGPKGDVGPTGPQGIQGPMGPMGPQGPKGADAFCP